MSEGLLFLQLLAVVAGLPAMFVGASFAVLPSTPSHRSASVFLMIVGMIVFVSGVLALATSGR